jgi:hypothetical protein
MMSAMTDGKASQDLNTLLGMLSPGGAVPSVIRGRGGRVRMDTLMDTLDLNVDQRLEILKILQLRAIESQLEVVASRCQLILEQLAESRAAES